MPRQCQRIIALPGDGLQFILLEHAIEMAAPEIFSMYKVKHTNVVCVTRNADLDATEGTDESDEDYREHMKRILKKRARLAPVRLESERKLSSTVGPLLMKRLNLKEHQTFVTSVPLDMSYTYDVAARLPEKQRATLTNAPFAPQWPASLDQRRPIIEQVAEREVLLSYPYESMDPFVQLLREAAHDPAVVSIKITLYRLARQSHLAEALIAAAEEGKEVTALFELRARFDESNNIEWSQRFEQAGCNVIYGFRDYKVHSKICCITRQTEHSLQHITQLGTGNYNEKTARLYTDLSYITTDPTIGRDAVEFFRNMGLENTSDNYDILWVAPLQIKPKIMEHIDEQIAPCPGRAGVRRVLQDQFHHRQGHHGEAGGGRAGGRSRDAVRARHLLPRAGRARSHRRRARGVHRGAPAGAQPHLRVRPARGHEGVPFERRPHDPQHGETHRDSLARPQPQFARADTGIPGHLHGRHGEVARASAQPHLHAAGVLRPRGRAGPRGAVRFPATPHRGGSAPPPKGRRAGRAARDANRPHAPWRGAGDRRGGRGAAGRRRRGGAGRRCRSAADARRAAGTPHGRAARAAARASRCAHWPSRRSRQRAPRSPAFSHARSPVSCGFRGAGGRGGAGRHGEARAAPFAARPAAPRTAQPVYPPSL